MPVLPDTLAWYVSIQYKSRMETPERFSVMVIDDDRVSAYLTTCRLEESNLFRFPLVFHSADEALRYMREDCLESFTTKHPSVPQILLIDVNMPTKDGFELVEGLLDIYPDLKQRTTLCFLSFSDHPRDKQKAEEMGVDCYVVQPLNDWHCRQIAQVATAKNNGLLMGH